MCHIDLHAAWGDWPLKPALPFIPGHEGMGVVAAVPDDFAPSLVMLAKSTGPGFTHALAVDKVTGVTSLQCCGIPRMTKFKRLL